MPERLLIGAQGDRLRHVAVLGEHSPRIASAIQRLHTDFDQPLPVEKVELRASRFYHHFKALTGMTPLPFQKQLRLQEARQLLFAHKLNAAPVGYNSASHFNQDYKRLFGAPPLQDVERLREATRESAL